MSWIDDRLADQKMLQEHQRQVAERQRMIAEQAEAVYEKLWEEIKEVLKEMASKGLKSFMNGLPLQRTIRRPGTIKEGTTSHPGHEIQVSLVADRQSISVTGDVRLSLQLDLSEDAVICLKLGGVPTTLRAAANSILDNFYFPELQPPV
ncbi:MAG TPA: hypothetical protein VG897_12900 [Terriglobales bacterium]|nr:hypothetical protein [Terriglobales bacterium]